MSVIAEKPQSETNLLKFEISKSPELAVIEEELRRAVSGSDGLIKEMCTHLLDSGGKRLRPTLVLYSGLCFSPLTKELVQTAVAAELIHMASLVHDDIIDRADMRRNRPTLNAQWGNHCAVLTGDYLFATAIDILSSSRLLPTLNLMVNAIQQMCEGEILQANDQFNFAISEEEYFIRIAKKTAILIAVCCQAGAIAAGANDTQVSALREFGLNLGYAFQIIDDILDFTGNSATLGKPVGLDLAVGNITLPMILLLKKEHYQQALQPVIRNKQVTAPVQEYIGKILQDSGALQEAFSFASVCALKAKHSLHSIPASPYREILIGLPDKVLTRCN